MSRLLFYPVLILSLGLNWALSFVWLVTLQTPIGPLMISTSARCWLERDGRFYGWLRGVVDAVFLHVDGPDHCERAHKDWAKGKMWTPDALG